MSSSKPMFFSPGVSGDYGLIWCVCWRHLAPPERIELSTFCLEGKHSDPLSYGGVVSLLELESKTQA